MKTLRLIKTGLITHQTFPLHQVHSPFFSQGNYTINGTGLNLSYGMIFTFLEDYERVVFEVHSDYVPQNNSEFGGITISRGEYITSLQEYNPSLEEVNYNYTRVFKNKNKYYGEASVDGSEWIDKEFVEIPKAETMGVAVQGNTPFLVKELKLYRDPCFYIFNVYDGYAVKIYDLENNLLKTVDVNKVNIAKIQAPIYPFSCRMEILDNSGRVVVNQEMLDIWGGDEFTSSLNIDLFTQDGINLHEEEAKHLGYVKSGSTAYEKITAVNNLDIYTNNVYIRILESSPAYDWVYLSTNTSTLGNYEKEIVIDIDALGRTDFLIRIKQPDDFTGIADYNPTEETKFYIAVGDENDVIISEGFLFAPVGMPSDYIGTLLEDGILVGTDVLYE